MTTPDKSVVVQVINEAYIRTEPVYIYDNSRQVNGCTGNTQVMH